MTQDIQLLQAGDIGSTDILTRLEFATGSVGLKRNWFAKTRGIGSSIVFDSTTLFAWDTNGIGSVFFDALSGIAFTTVASGGTF